MSLFWARRRRLLWLLLLAAHAGHAAASAHHLLPVETAGVCATTRGATDAGTALDAALTS
jgi:hypothetical protein